MKLKKGAALLLTSLLLLCTGCFSDRPVDGDGDDGLLPDSSLTEQIFAPPGEVIAYEYPADQAQALKDVLDRAVTAGGVDFTVGEVNAWEDIYGKRREIPVYWRGEQTHGTVVCVHYHQHAHQREIYGRRYPAKEVHGGLPHPQTEKE